MTNTTQFSVAIKTKNRLDRYKADNKEDIITALKLRRRMVTNSHAIDYLLNKAGAR